MSFERGMSVTNILKYLNIVNTNIYSDIRLYQFSGYKYIRIVFDTKILDFRLYEFSNTFWFF